eukprot:3947648-Alexandrium_andersonii.AAC.1
MSSGNSATNVASMLAACRTSACAQPDSQARRSSSEMPRATTAGSTRITGSPGVCWTARPGGVSAVPAAVAGGRGGRAET